MPADLYQLKHEYVDRFHFDGGNQARYGPIQTTGPRQGYDTPITGLLQNIVVQNREFEFLHIPAESIGLKNIRTVVFPDDKAAAITEHGVFFETGRWTKLRKFDGTFGFELLSTSSGILTTSLGSLINMGFCAAGELASNFSVSFTVRK